MSWFKRNIALLTDAVLLCHCRDLYSANLTELKIAAFVPFNGSWPYGLEIAEVIDTTCRHINDDQVLLPGYNLTAAFFNSACDSRTAVHAFKTAMDQENQDTGSVGILGPCCSFAAAPIAAAAPWAQKHQISGSASMAFLSDRSLYPYFYRTITIESTAQMMTFVNHMGWKKVALIAGDPETADTSAALERGIHFAISLVSVTYIFPSQGACDMEGAFLCRGRLASCEQAAGSIIDGRIRVVIASAWEAEMRCVLCALSKTGYSNAARIVWVTWGWFPDGWFNFDFQQLRYVARDTASKLSPELVYECSKDELAAMVSFSFGVSSSSEASQSYQRRSTPLTCFPSFTSSEFYNEVEASMSNGSRFLPEFVFIVDTVCLWALVLRELLVNQGIEPKLLRGRLDQVHFDTMNAVIQSREFVSMQSERFRFARNAGHPDGNQYGVYQYQPSQNGTCCDPRTAVFTFIDTDTTTNRNASFKSIEQILWWDGAHPDHCPADTFPEPVDTSDSPSTWSTVPPALAVIIAISFGVLIVACVAFLCFWARCRNVSLDAPNIRNSPSGAWVLKWVGPVEYTRLVEMDPIGSPTLLCERRLASNEMQESWLVNASPFLINVGCESSDVPGMTIAPSTFCRLMLPLKGRMEFDLRDPEGHTEKWKRLSCVNSVAVDFPGDFCNPDNQYDDDLARFPLLGSADTPMLGHIKLTRCPTVLLLSWSPPAVLRGVPLAELERFFTEVIEHPDTWMCHGNVSKGKGSHKRNMYDACKNMIEVGCARVDASYAEHRTEYGPPEIFISHVWLQTAFNSRNTIRKLKENIETGRLRIGRSMSGTDSNELGEPTPQLIVKGTMMRAWFCTLCNNQSRLNEEIGDDVLRSPFANVIRSPMCCLVVIFSPFLALERKWCIFEFSITKESGKLVQMATPDGIVQAGQVTPERLFAMSEKIQSFDCKLATCTSAEDNTKIESAVERMGGYAVLNKDLKEVFHKAIEDAHAWTTRSLANFGNVCVSL